MLRKVEIQIGDRGSGHTWFYETPADTEIGHGSYDPESKTLLLVLNGREHKFQRDDFWLYSWSFDDELRCGELMVGLVRLSPNEFELIGRSGRSC